MKEEVVANTRSDVANSGVVRPPLIYVSALVLGVLLHLVFPIRIMRTAVNVPIGVLTIAGGVILFLKSVRSFRSAGTPVPGNRPTTAIVRTGPYRFSRNPIYLAFSLLLLGISIWIGAIWLLVTLAAAIGIMNFVVIPREERYLEAHFPTEYEPYKAEVRRWL